MKAKSSNNGKSNGLHKSYFNGSPVEHAHPIPKAPSNPTPKPKGC